MIFLSRSGAKPSQVPITTPAKAGLPLSPLASALWTVCFSRPTAEHQALMASLLPQVVSQHALAASC